jgi:glucuronate isomerase
LGFIEKLGDIKCINCLEEKIEQRLQDFIKVGTTAADIALQSVYKVSDKKSAAEVFKRRLNGEEITEEDAKIFKGYLTYFLFKLYAKYDIATELHLGAMRNNNAKMLKTLGLDTGYDSIAEDNSIKYMSRLFDKLNCENSLPKTIVFNLNPKMNTEIMTLIGSFQDSSVRGKVQFGPAWWFLDNKVGMEKHLEDLTATGHIDSFIGMLTDSRSFLSYPRHHYFRRILCSYLGEMVENGEIAVIIVNDEEVTLKRFFYYPELNQVVLQPENPAFRPMIYMNEELAHIRVLGKAVAFTSSVI